MSPAPTTTFRPDEFEQWCELFRAYNAFYGVELDAEVYTVTWRRLLEPDGGLFGFTVRDAGGRPAGLVHYLFHGSSWSVTDVCYLEDLFVAPEARGRGFGLALIAAVADAARARKCQRLYWLTQATNLTARRLYDTVAVDNGFVRYDVRL